MPSGEIEIGDHHADEADHRADRQVDAAGENDEGRADRRRDDEGVVGEDVTENQGRKKVLVEEAADEKQRDEDGDRGKKRKVLLVHRFVLTKTLYSAVRRLVDCRSSTMMTTIALTTRLYSGGRPLVRIEVVSA